MTIVIDMDAKAALKYAADKLSPDDAAKVLERSGLVFDLRGQNAEFKQGSMRSLATNNPKDGLQQPGGEPVKDEQGQVIGGGVGDFTGVRLKEEQGQPGRSSLSPDPVVPVVPRNQAPANSTVTEQIGNPDSRRETVRGTVNQQGEEHTAVSTGTSIHNAPGRL